MAAYIHHNSTNAQQGRRGSIDTIITSNSAGDSCEVALFGAHLLSWKHHQWGELLFLSERTDYSGNKPLRGGIPLVFPQFGLGPLPAHGFLRTSLWVLQGINHGSNNTSIVFELRNSAATHAIWPHPFKATYRIELSTALATQLTIENVGEGPFTFQAAFHTYFAIQKIEATEIRGLNSITFIDATQKKARNVEQRENITFTEQTDRVYVNAPARIEIVDHSQGTTFIIEKDLPDAVVWNPWIERCSQIADLNSEDYRKFVCVEAGVIDTPISLPAGGLWTGSQRISVTKPV